MSREAADRRLATLIEPALAQLSELAVSAQDESVRLRAVVDLLDRAGLKPVGRTDLTSNGQTLRIVIGPEDADELQAQLPQPS